MILFATNTFTGEVFRFDNFDGYMLAGSGGSPPVAPSSLGATGVSSSQIDLAWSDSSDDEIGFRIERACGGSGFSEIATVGADLTSCPDSGLAVLTTYDYRVHATNASGDSAYSNTASATTAGGGTPTTMHVASIVVGTRGACSSACAASAPLLALSGGRCTIPVTSSLSQPPAGGVVPVGRSHPLDDTEDLHQLHDPRRHRAGPAPEPGACRRAG